MQKMHLCSAVILSRRHVVTAASCLTDYPMKKYRVVMAGREEGEREQEFHVQSIFTHDGYDETTSENDLALVKLKAGKQPARFGRFANRQVQFFS